MAPTPALADQAAAQALFDQGQALAEAGDYEGACPKFAAAVKLYPEGLGAIGRLADCYERIGKHASAWATWREVSVLAGKAGETERQEFANKRIEVLEPKLSYLTVKVDEPVAGMAIERNGQVVAEGMLGSAITVDPGVIEITATAEGYEGWEGTVSVTEASRQTVTIPALVKAKVVEKPRTDLTQGTAPSPARSKGLFYGGIGAAGAGAVLMGASVVVGLSAKSDYDSAFEGDPPDCTSDNMCNAEGFDTTEDARKKATTATILFASGAAVAVAGGVMIWLSGRDRGEAGERAVTLAPRVTPSDVGFAVLGRF